MLASLFSNSYIAFLGFCAKSWGYVLFEHGFLFVSFSSPPYSSFTRISLHPHAVPLKSGLERSPTLGRLVGLREERWHDSFRLGQN